MQQDIRNVLTFWIDRGWNEKDWEYTNRSVKHGYEALNEVVNDLSRRVLVLSISYTHMRFPGGQVRLFATVLYNGPSAFAIYGPKNPHGPGAISGETTLIELWQKGSTKAGGNLYVE